MRSSLSAFHNRSCGFTLVEVLTAAALAVMLLLIITVVFADVSGTINEYRASIEMRSQLRQLVQRLQDDLSGATAVPFTPPINPADNRGYFVVKEGPIGPIYRPEVIGSAELGTSLRGQTISLRRRLTADPTLKELHETRPLEIDMRLGDTDDILAFTTRFQDTEDEAEIAWFVRGTTLYRQFRRINPYSTGQGYDFSAGSPPPPRGYDFFQNSYRVSGGPYDPSWRIDHDADWVVLHRNTLGEVTKPENRHGHLPRLKPPLAAAGRYFQHDIRFWGELGLPTAAETMIYDWQDYDNSWPYPWAEHFGERAGLLQTPYNVVVPKGLTLNSRGWVQLTPYAPEGFPLPFDPEFLPLPYQELTATYEELASDPSRRLFSGYVEDIDPDDSYNPNDQIHYYSGRVFASDSVLRNVLAFDVKVWDPNAPIFPSTATSGDVNSAARRPITPDHPDYLIRVKAGAAPIHLGAFVDLNYMCLLGDRNQDGQPDYGRLPFPHFHGPGTAMTTGYGTVRPCLLYGQSPHESPFNAIASVYDTWTTHYENDGLDQDFDGMIDEGTNGVNDPSFDADNNGTPDTALAGIDDPTEREAVEPYRYPLRGVQITLRVFDPDTQEIREVLISQDFIVR